MLSHELVILSCRLLKRFLLASSLKVNNSQKQFSFSIDTPKQYPQWQNMLTHGFDLGTVLYEKNLTQDYGTKFSDTSEVKSII